jgi:enterochelin esterase family protein
MIKRALVRCTHPGLLVAALATGCAAGLGPALPDLGLEDGSASGDQRDVDGPVRDHGADLILPDANPCSPVPPQPNLARFDKLEQEVAAATSAGDRQALVDTFWSALANEASYPLRDGATVLFLHKGTAVALSGTFNGWKADEMLVQLADTDLYFRKQSIPAGAAQYKFIDGANWFSDPLNKHVAWDGIETGGLGAFNSVAPDVSAPSAGGRLEWTRVASPQFGHTRDVFVYLPESYDLDTCRRYPTLYVHDGNESITRSHFDQVAGQVFQAKQAAEAILVFVALASQNDRIDEYSCEETSKGPEYADFLCDTLVKTVIDIAYRTSGKAEERGLVGASLGGLISYAALFWRNDCFQLAASQSGSFWYAENMMVKRVQATTPNVALTRAYLDNGQDNRESTLAMAQALKDKGYPVYHWEKLEQGHTWDAWQDRFDEVLSYLFPPKP